MFGWVLVIIIGVHTMNGDRKKLGQQMIDQFKMNLINVMSIMKMHRLEKLIVMLASRIKYLLLHQLQFLLY